MMEQKMHKGKLFIVSAPSGTGKTTLVKFILERMGPLYSIDRVITYTSRKQRPEEIHGVDYHFISFEDFKNKIEKSFFLEWSNFYGDYYGTPQNIKSVLESGKTLIAVVDRPGAEKILQNIEDAVAIWVYASNLEALHERLLKRGTEKTEEIQKRLALARLEMQEESTKPLYRYHLKNDDFDEAFRRLERIFIKELRNIIFK